MSPAATQTSDEAVDAVLRAADDLFYRAGISAVKMSDVRDNAGVSMRRLYTMYPHKTDLVSAWLAHRHETWMTSFEFDVGRRLAVGSTPVDAIFDALAAWLQASGFRGCGFINSLAETGVLTAEHKRIIRAHKQAVIDFLAAFTEHPDTLAVLVDGAIIQAAIFRSPEPIVAAKRAAQPLITMKDTT